MKSRTRARAYQTDWRRLLMWMTLLSGVVALVMHLIEAR
jgi:hypothetical protein